MLHHRALGPDDVTTLSVITRYHRRNRQARLVIISLIILICHERLTPVLSEMFPSR